jgi:hypothetical protein
MFSMRRVIAITSLCSLSLFSACVALDKPALLGNQDGGRDGKSFDLPAGISDLRDQSPDLISPSPGPDSAPDMVNTAGDLASDGLPGSDAGTDTPSGPETVTDTAPSAQPDAVDDATKGVPPEAGAVDALILSGTCAIADSPAPPGTICRASAGPCDVAEFCDGVSTACPFDAFKAKTEICRAKAGDCDQEETCTGTSAACPDDKILGQGATCRSAVSICDVAEYCDGVNPACPVDVFAPATPVITCRASTDGNVCDPEEDCTGTSNQCPADAKYSAPTAAPTGVAVIPGNLQVDVSWNAVTGATGYNVKRSTVSGAGYATVGSSLASPLTVPMLNATQTHYFVVTAFAGQSTCESPYSSPPVSALSCVATAPTGLVAKPDTAGNVVLTWTAVVGAASYSVSRSSTSGSGYAILASGPTKATYTDKPGVPAGGTATFYYVVRANTGTCLSAYSTEAKAVIGSAGADAGADSRADVRADTAKD